MSGHVLTKQTKDQDNFYRLARLLIVGGTRVLRDILDHKHPPSVLPSTLAHPSIKATLKSKTNKQQKSLLYPSTGKYGNSEDFDISLLTLLIQHTNTLPTPPSLGWSTMPHDTDLSLAADVVRVKMLRNEVYGHTNTMEITDAKFLTLWDTLSDAFIRIESIFGTTKKIEWINAIQEFLTSPLTESDTENVQELERWYVQEEEIKKQLLGIEIGIADVRETLDEIKSLHTPTSETCPKEHHKAVPLSYICYSCKTRTCEHCQTIEHRSHNVYPCENDPMLIEATQSINDEIMVAQNKLVNCEHEAYSIAQKYEDGTARLKGIQNMIHNFAEKSIDKIRQQERELTNEIEQLCNDSAVDVEEIKQCFLKYEEEINKAIASARVLLEKGDGLAIFLEADSVKNTLHELSTTEIITKRLSCERQLFVPNAKFFDDLYRHGIGRISAVDPSKCTATGQGVDSIATLYQGLETSFVVTVFSARGEFIHVPPEVLSVFISYQLESDKNTVKSNIVREDISKSIEDNRDGTYTVYYIPQEIGTAIVSVKVEGESIKERGFEVNVKKRKYETVCLLGKKGTGNGNFDGPWGSAENSTGDIYITDGKNHRVQVFNKDLSWMQTIGEYGTDDGAFINPRGITIDRNDNIIVVDNGNNRVQIFNKHGTFMLKFGSAGVKEGCFQSPYSAAMDDNDNLIISDCDNQRVQIFTTDGKFVRSFGQGVIRKSCYCIYHKGYYILSDFESHCIRFFNKDGQFIEKFGKFGTWGGEFDDRIRGLGINKVGNLLVCGSYADRIQVFQLSGSSLKFLEQFGKVGKKKGQFKQPTTVNVLRNGRILVCECHNCRVQIF